VTGCEAPHHFECVVDRFRAVSTPKIYDFRSGNRPDFESQTILFPDLPNLSCLCGMGFTGTLRRPGPGIDDRDRRLKRGWILEAFNIGWVPQVPQ